MSLLFRSLAHECRYLSSRGSRVAKSTVDYLVPSLVFLCAPTLYLRFLQSFLHYGHHTFNTWGFFIALDHVQYTPFHLKNFSYFLYHHIIWVDQISGSSDSIIAIRRSPPFWKWFNSPASPVKHSRSYISLLRTWNIPTLIPILSK